MNTIPLGVTSLGALKAEPGCRTTRSGSVQELIEIGKRTAPAPAVGVLSGDRRRRARKSLRSGSSCWRIGAVACAQIRVAAMQDLVQDADRPATAEDQRAGQGDAAAARRRAPAHSTRRTQLDAFEQERQALATALLESGPHRQRAMETLASSGQGRAVPEHAPGDGAAQRSTRPDLQALAGARAERRGRSAVREGARDPRPGRCARRLRLRRVHRSRNQRNSMFVGLIPLPVFDHGQTDANQAVAEPTVQANRQREITSPRRRRARSRLGPQVRELLRAAQPRPARAHRGSRARGVAAAEVDHRGRRRAAGSAARGRTLGESCCSRPPRPTTPPRPRSRTSASRPPHRVISPHRIRLSHVRESSLSLRCRHHRRMSRLAAVIPPPLLWLGVAAPSSLFSASARGAAPSEPRGARGERARRHPDRPRHGDARRRGLMPKVRPDRAGDRAAGAGLPRPGHVELDERRTSAIGAPLPGCNASEAVAVRRGGRRQRKSRARSCCRSVQRRTFADVQHEIVDEATTQVAVKKRIVERGTRVVSRRRIRHDQLQPRPSCGEAELALQNAGTATVCASAPTASTRSG